MVTRHVKIGEVVLGEEGDVLTANLGSDLGLLFVWSDKKLFGMAHCLLPESPTGLLILSGRFVSQAIPSLIEVMGINSENLNQIEVHIMGGGGDHANPIARKNIEAAEIYLGAFGFRIKSVDVGGKFARHMIVDCSANSVHVVPLEEIA